MLAKPDEWGVLDVALAQRILRERGQELPPVAVAALAATRNRALADPQEVAGGWLALGYVSAGLGGLLGILLGWYLNTHRTTLPDGQQVMAYAVHTRLPGRVMMGIGTVVFVVLLLSRTLLRAGVG
ncbi:MAG: hypothetical protein H7330_05895 [Hymenobacteraceae bacterium]|nr:hypothetical protein [Hymenobacteraceae bacterium]